MKQHKKRSYSRLVISFFINRAVEISESIIQLIKENRLADSAVLLRSFWEMAINTDYIFNDLKMKEINAIKYLLNESQSQINILENNYEEFMAAGLRVEERIRQKRKTYEREKASLTKKYKLDDWTWPKKIFARVKNSKQEVIKKAYHQIYAHYCNIEHHDMSFGQNYIDEDKCEPLEEKRLFPLTGPKLSIFMCRAILLVIMKTFNEEFGQKWEGILRGLEEQHDMEYEEMKKEEGIV